MDVRGERVIQCTTWAHICDWRSYGFLLGIFSYKDDFMLHLLCKNTSVLEVQCNLQRILVADIEEDSWDSL